MAEYNVLPTAFNDPDSPVTPFNTAFGVNSTGCGNTPPKHSWEGKVIL